MKYPLLSCTLIVTCLLVCFPAHGDEKGDKFEAQFRQAQALLKENKLPEAYAAVQAAARVDPSRYETSGFAALVLLKDGKITAAREALADARKLAPATAAKKLDDIGKLIETTAAATPAGTGNSAANMNAQASTTSPLTGAARRKYDTLLVIVEEADQAKSPAERRKLLDELLFKSGEFVREYPDVLQVWTLRAAAGLELEQKRMAWEASSEMIRLGAENSEDPKVRQLLAKLDRKGWLKTKAQLAEAIEMEAQQAKATQAEEERQRMAEKAAADSKWKAMLEKGWQNSLGMKFVQVPNTDVLFCIWETRVQDYKEYLRANGKDSNLNWELPGEGIPKRAPRNVIGGYNYGGYDISTPVIIQSGPTYPVIKLEESDVLSFCEWLTKKERAEGRLNDQVYRLPTLSEWKIAAIADEKKNTHLWGNDFPPRTKVGNLASTEVRTVFAEPYVDAMIQDNNYSDGFATTAPVGSYPPNKFGIFDMIGNVEEACFDSEKTKHCVVFGGSWRKLYVLEGDYYNSFHHGFRIVLAKPKND